jgi:hypothetical protein
MVSRAIWKNIHSWVFLIVCEKTHSCMFSQIALEPYYYTILLHHTITPYYYTILLHHTITPYYYTILLHHTITYTNQQRLNWLHFKFRHKLNEEPEYESYTTNRCVNVPKVSCNRIRWPFTMQSENVSMAISLLHSYIS